MKRYKLDRRSANDERKMWESEQGDWIEYENVVFLASRASAALEGLMKPTPTLGNHIDAENVYKELRKIVEGN